jgi:hypothetical protein
MFAFRQVEKLEQRFNRRTLVAVCDEAVIAPGPASAVFLADSIMIE